MEEEGCDGIFIGLTTFDTHTRKLLDVFVFFPQIWNNTKHEVEVVTRTNRANTKF